MLLSTCSYRLYRKFRFETYQALFKQNDSKVCSPNNWFCCSKFEFKPINELQEKICPTNEAIQFLEIQKLFSVFEIWFPSIDGRLPLVVQLNAVFSRKRLFIRSPARQTTKIATRTVHFKKERLLKKLRVLTSTAQVSGYPLESSDWIVSALNSSGEPSYQSLWSPSGMAAILAFSRRSVSLPV